MPGTVIFLGAGATKACGGPLTGEILPAVTGGSASPDPAGRLPLLYQFLQDQFHVVAGVTPWELYPGLPLLMSLLDTAIDRRQPLHSAWDANSIVQIREAIEFGIFDVLEEKLVQAPTNNHYVLLEQLFPAAENPCVISTNYDLIVDTAMMFLSEYRLPPDGGLPDYRCGISSDFYRQERAHFGTLLKLHGSLNWLHCKTCNRMEMGASDSKKYYKVMQRVAGPSLQQSFYADGAQCPTCHSKLRPLLIAPTHFKDYRNPHLAQVWYEAERVLRDAKRVFFIGYSLPDDDVEVVYLLKRSMINLEPKDIVVVEYDPANPPLTGHPVGRRYRALFGDGIQWHPEGLDDWLLKAASAAA